MALTQAKTDKIKNGCTLFDGTGGAGDDLLTMQTATTTNTTNISTNTSSISTNTSNISTNTSTIGTHTTQIATLNGYVDQSVKAAATPSFVAAKATGELAGGFMREVTVADYSATDADQAYSVDNVLGGIIRRGGLSATRTDTLPTAALLVAGLTSPQVGEMIEFSIQQETVAAQALVVQSGVGGTDVATTLMRTVGAESVARFGIVLTNVTASSEAYSLYRLS